MTRVSLRRALPDDADFLYGLIVDPAIRPFLGLRAGHDRAALAAEIDRSAAEPDAFGRFVIEVDGEPAGCVGFHRVNERHRIAELERFALLRRFWGTGIADEAARLVQRHLLVDLDFHRLELQIYGFNTRAIAQAGRAGYVREGVKRRAYLRDGEWQDAVVFSLLREELE